MDKFNNKVRKIYTLGEVLNDNSIPPLSIIGNGILLDKTLLMICGEKKVGKSMLVYNLALAIASGKSFACFPIPNPKKVLVLSAEGGFDPNSQRLKKMVTHFQGVTSEYFNIQFNSNFLLNNPSDYTALCGIITEKGINVLVIDPFIKFHDVEENGSTEIMKVLRPIRNMIEELNISVILVHHFGKNASAGARGSSAISGEYDSAIEISKNKKGVKLSYDMRHVETPDDDYLVLNKQILLFGLLQGEDVITQHFSQPGLSMSKSEMKKYLVDQEICKSVSSAYRFIKKEIDNGVFEFTIDKQIVLAKKNIFPFSDSKWEKIVRKWF